MKVWIALFIGQVVSLIGSNMTGFALGLKVYQAEHSVTLFALISFATLMPQIVLSAFIGTLVDRWNRRTSLIIGNLGAGLGTVLIIILNASDQLSISAILLLVALSSAFNALILPAFLAATTSLVAKEKLSQANGFMQLGAAISQIAAPAMAAALLVSQGLGVILMLDVITFSFSLLVLALNRIPDHLNKQTNPTAARSLSGELKQAWNFLRERHGLLWLLGFISLINFNFGMVNVLLTPLVLSFTNEIQLGLIMSIAGSGMLIGALMVTLWKGLDDKVLMILSLLLLQGIIFLCALIPPSFILYAALGFFVAFTIPVITTSNQVIWQRKVMPEIQGRVYGLRTSISNLFLPLALIISGPLADKVFEPLMADDGPLADSIGLLTGTGSGRGIALFLAIIGCLTIIAVLFAWSKPALRLIEQKLPDQI
jgi:DHA3 family macrolide efflux protein-like MFS transporter